MRPRVRAWLVRAAVTGAVTAGLSLAAWAGSTVIADGNRITKLEAQREDVVGRLDRIEQKVDTLLLYRRSGR